MLRGLLLLALMSLAGFSQEFRATLLGRIADPSGSVIPGARITATNEATGVSSPAVSAADGAYNIPFLNPGRYRLEVEASGFKKYVQSGITLIVGQRVTQNVTLQLGDLAESVTVNAEAPLLESSTANMGQVVDQQKMDALPLNGRMIFMMNQISTAVQWRQPQLGATGSTGLRPFDNNGGSDWSINGARLRSNEYLVDGAPNTFRGRYAFGPPVDAIQEYRIHAADYDAQFSHGGGGTISMTTKSGTNQFHGTVWEYLKNDKLNANSSLANARGLPKDAMRSNTYGFLVSGPVIRNKTFFMYTYDALKERVPFPTVSSVPVAAERAGVFEGTGITVFDPLTTRRNAAGTLVRDAFPANRIPAGRIDPVGAKLIALYPLPNLPGRVSNYGANPNMGRYDYWAQLIRVDQNLSDKNKLFATYYRNTRQERRNQNGFGPPDSPRIAITGEQPQQRGNVGGVLDLVRTLNPTAILNVRAAIAHFDETSVQDQREGFDPSTLGFRNFPYATTEPTAPQLELEQFTTLGPRGIDLKNPSDSTGTLQANLTKVFSRHTLKTGGVFILGRYGQMTTGYSSGLFSFNRAFTRRDPNRADADSGSAAASLLLGYPSSGRVDVNGSSASQFKHWAGFVQEDIRVSSKLTVNLGLRWEYRSAFTERYNRYVRGFDFDSPNPLSQNPAVIASGLAVKGGLVYAGVGGQPRKIADDDLNNWQPRAGAAYQLGNRTVLRGGYGLFHGFSRFTGVQTGFSQSTSYISSTDGGLTPELRENTLSNPFPRGLVRPAGSSLGMLQSVGLGIIFQDPTFRSPETHQFSFGIQRQLRRDLLVDASYVGSRGRKLPALGLNQSEAGTTGMNINATSAADLERAFATNGRYFQDQVANPFRGLMTAGSSINGATVTRETLLRPYPHFTSIRRDGWSIGKSSYNSLQVRLEKRYGFGLNFTTAYTLSKYIDGAGFNNDYPLSQEPIRQLSEVDSTHRWSFAGIYDLPFGKGRPFGANGPAALNHLVGGWQINWLITYQSGLPLTVPSGLESLGNANLKDRTLDRWFNTCYVDTAGRQRSCMPGEQPVWFVRPPFTIRTTPARFPDLRANSRPNYDLSVFKNFEVTERLRLEYRCEFLNAMNMAFFGNRGGGSAINTTFDSPNFGAAGAVGGPRTQYNFPRMIQMALRLRF